MRFILPLALVAALAAPVAATAQTASPIAWSVGAGTDYRSKGTSKTDDAGYAFATADWKSSDGRFYAGAAVATIDMASGATWETDLKFGVRPQRIAGWDTDFTVFYRAFQDANPGVDADYVEFRAQAQRAFGPVTIRALTWYTPDNAGAVEAAQWSEARATVRVRPGVRASAALGRHDQDNGPDYAAWNAGLAFDVTPKVELDLRWYDTDGHENGSRYEGEAVAALTYRF